MEDTISWNGISLGAEMLAVGLLVAGFVIARVASYLVGRMLSAMDRRVARMATSEASVFRPRVIGVARASIFWLVFLFAIAMALRTLGFGPFSTLSGAAVDFIPQALVSFAIIAAGHLVGLLASNLVTKLNRDLPPDSIVPQLVYGAVLSVAIVMGLEHIAVDISFVTRLLLVAVAIVGGGIMLAFALGSKRYVGNLLAHRELEPDALLRSCAPA